VRITHVTDVYLPRLGGIEVHVAELARRQQRDGHQVQVITATAAGPGGAADAGSAADAVQDQLTSRVGGRFPVVVGWSPGTGRRASAELIGSGTELVHVHLGGVAPTGWAAIRAAGRAGIPTVVTVHSRLDGLRALHRLAGLSYGWGRLPLVWTAVGQRVSEQLERTLRLDPPVAVLPNAVDRSYWRPTGAPPVREEVLLVSALRQTRRKRAEALIRILADLRRRTPEQIRLTAVIAGDGPRRAAVQRSVQRAGLSDWVRMPGRMTRDELRDLYHRADLFLAPTRLESFGIAALEARQAGLPVIALADSGTAEVLEHGREALLARSDDDLAAAAASLVVDPARRLAIAAHNRGVGSGFGWERCLDRTYAAYTDALDAARRRDRTGARSTSGAVR
jgi:phosphatidylinositol alpha 1,6-mannosyltransferase